MYHIRHTLGSFSRTFFTRSTRATGRSVYGRKEIGASQCPRSLWPSATARDQPTRFFGWTREGHRTVDCTSGVQQRDPTLPALFSLSLQPGLCRYRATFEGKGAEAFSCMNSLPLTFHTGTCWDTATKCHPVSLYLLDICTTEMSVTVSIHAPYKPHADHRRNGPKKILH